MPASRRGRIRTAAGWAAAAALVSGVALAGCEAAPGGGPGAASRPYASPSPRPTPAWDTSPASVAAVGDSITRGFDACGLLVDCPEVSWATGGDARVNSLARRLVGPSALPARSWNLARSGARMAELPGQMAAAGAKRPGLVTVMAGANDACRDSTGLMTPVSSFRSSFEEAMRALRAVSPKSQVYVSSVPDLKRLWTTGRGSALGKQVWKLGVCRSMLGDADDVGAAAVERREEVYRRVVAYNEVLRDVCAKDRLCRYDGGAVFDYRFTGAQLSPWDWFHPSTDGQGRLAEIAYRIVTS
ncbi:SGNH/GDSL hydrolase family protein [Streptomyces sp. NPDC057116]|uniref:SGNH/GDSL hydrolase family protein n=1 Tax=Streptomyces sp. NPDC057116 TaxID=3346023 RepID=UPI003640972A